MPYLYTSSLKELSRSGTPLVMRDLCIRQSYTGYVHGRPYRLRTCDQTYRKDASGMQYLFELLKFLKLKRNRFESSPKSGKGSYLFKSTNVH